MTERGLPIVDGAPACPFVAFEDDRDERAASPDHRHRCYAEAQPAPRALAHQEAYCLSSAFPVCPTFQDWARREAARARASASKPVPPESVDAGADPGSQRNPPRNWAAPPPWTSRKGRDEGAAGSIWADEGPDDGDDGEAAADIPRRGRGLSGSYADRVASGPGAAMAGGAPEDGEDDDAGYGDGDEDRDADEAAQRRDEPARRGPFAAQADAVPRRRHREREAVGPVGAGTAAAAAGARVAGGRGPAPEWERAKPLEAYPTLRSRRLPELSVPPILVAVVAIALAAAVLFALPGLLGFGEPSAGGSPSPTTPVITAIPSFVPTAVPQPTATFYVVQSGDTLSRIAGRFGITLADLIAANAETLPDPDKLQIGDQLIIPVPLASELPAASEIPAAS